MTTHVGSGKFLQGKGSIVDWSESSRRSTGVVPVSVVGL